MSIFLSRIWQLCGPVLGGGETGSAADSASFLENTRGSFAAKENSPTSEVDGIEDLLRQILKMVFKLNRREGNGVEAA